jgi:hypothetical protein
VRKESVATWTFLPPQNRPKELSLSLLWTAAVFLLASPLKNHQAGFQKKTCQGLVQSAKTKQTDK